MSNRRNAVLTGLAVGCVIFLCLVVAAHLQTLVALVLAVAGGGAALAALSRRPATLPPAEPAPVPIIVPAPSPPVQFQAQTVTGIRLPSALADYSFAFAANVLWLPSVDGVIGAGEIARSEIIRRAREFTERQDPRRATLIESELAMVLTALQPDPSGQVQVRAESVHLQLPPEDQQLLDEFAALRKQEGLWEYQRRYQVNKRHYLRTDVLKDPGSAVVWWLAQHEDQPQQVAQNIDVLTRLARAANNADSAAFDTPDAPQSPPATPQTPSVSFDAFLDSLNPTPSEDARLLLTRQVARIVDSHDQKAADDIRQRHSELDETNVGDGYPDPPDEEDDTLSG
jgi:hypothetical protein